MSALESKQQIETALRDFARLPLGEAAINLFAALGYGSARRVELQPNTAENFLATFGNRRPFNRQQSLVEDWKSVDFLFQLTDAEIQTGGQTRLQFDSRGNFDGAIIESYLFLAIDLKQPHYARGRLSNITRAINRLFDMPVMLLFRHGATLTLSIIDRRLHRRDESKDVLEKVTLIKDINYTDPLRPHLDILHDLSLAALYNDFFFQNFVGLHRAWGKRLDTEKLNRDFYDEIANWYFWALHHGGIVYPRDVRDEEPQSIFLIRLLTRLIFCWFLQEKGLIPRVMFRRRYAEQMLKDFSPRAGTFYQAFLQNLFFATLNQEPEARGFRAKGDGPGNRDGNRGATNLLRYAALLKDPDAFVETLGEVPFVNGGLFDCLDVVFGQKGTPDIRLDDFEEKNNPLCLPNELFFGEYREVDLSEAYGDARRRREHVRGLIDILDRYKFTVEESTPLEQEIALDPELLGRVFENLLASYNEDTRTTARKATGSFYTRREIVSYMVDESLIAYLEAALNDSAAPPQSPVEPRLRQLLTGAAPDFENPFTADESAALVAAIGRVKVLDPACGSGAFPMGALHGLVGLLQKLDPANEHWRALQRQRALDETDKAFRLGDQEERKHRLDDINEVFERNTSDYGRKLYLIENCIYGVDIQPIACQIAKLRFFIALIVDQQVNLKEKNLGVRPLPNLEAKIVAADTLIPIERPGEHQFNLLDHHIRPLRERLQDVRHEYFSARTPAKKRKCREQDKTLRRQIAELLQAGAGFPAEAAEAMAGWDPYDQNTHATFFDPEWMFGLPVGKIRLSKESPAALRGNFTSVNPPAGQMEAVAPEEREVESGFDIVIGNPPYIRLQTLKQKAPEMVGFLKAHYESARKGNYDVYVVFVERGLQLLKPTGSLAYILPHKFFNAQYGEPLRGLVAREKYLNQVVHFGDLQVFPGATNYVCLLFLHKIGADSLRFVKVVDLDKWLRSNQGIEARIPARRITSAEWNIAVGKGARVFDQLAAASTRLRDVADLFVGLQTDADDVFIVELVSQQGKTIMARSEYTGEEHAFESDHLKPLLKGSLNIRRYMLDKVTKRLIFPYETILGESALISQQAYAQRFPLTWAYLSACKKRLAARANGQLGNNWQGYVYKKNHTRFEHPKLVAPSIATEACFAADFAGRFYFVGSGGGGGGGYGIVPKADAGISSKALLALLNSRMSTYYLKQVSTPFRGGYIALNRQYIEQLPIPVVTASQQTALGTLVDYLLWLYRQPAGAGDRKASVRDPLMLNYFEQIINGLVYELFFDDELHAARLYPFKLIGQAQLPALDGISEKRRADLLGETFERLYDPAHPLRGCLHDLGSLETVRVIEGLE